ncbi:ABATE domain-containing protein [Actinophytocola algeriensis]|uniref:Uncharacterized protein n=1 Tax=Actinophytocola algeriensis TaxID=1768010 RepID=A0A7W7VGQ6_9PSEU|nr:ABATE domain-containing protein [Actinophytocola algeriensis]MBB4909598.1 hypothetical protein [Actinophytocola algeriensis]MBE1475588.1 hypothetical protein [Actinophytocola algeriensis]
MEHAFPCGTLALDFVGTLRARRNALPREMLGAPASLDAWFRESGSSTTTRTWTTLACAKTSSYGRRSTHWSPAGCSANRPTGPR